MVKQFIFITALFLVIGDRAYAYIDPGTGSMMLQVLLGFLLTGFFTFKLWIGKVTAIFKKEKKVDVPSDSSKNTE